MNASLRNSVIGLIVIAIIAYFGSGFYLKQMLEKEVNEKIAHFEAIYPEIIKNVTYQSINANPINYLQKKFEINNVAVTLTDLPEHPIFIDSISIKNIQPAKENHLLPEKFSLDINNLRIVTLPGLLKEMFTTDDEFANIAFPNNNDENNLNAAWLAEYNPHIFANLQYDTKNHAVDVDYHVILDAKPVLKQTARLLEFNLEPLAHILYYGDEDDEAFSKLKDSFKPVVLDYSRGTIDFNDSFDLKKNQEIYEVVSNILGYETLNVAFEMNSLYENQVATENLAFTIENAGKITSNYKLSFTKPYKIWDMFSLYTIDQSSLTVQDNTPDAALQEVQQILEENKELLSQINWHEFTIAYTDASLVERIYAFVGKISDQTTEQMKSNMNGLMKELANDMPIPRVKESLNAVAVFLVNPEQTLTLAFTPSQPYNLGNILGYFKELQAALNNNVATSEKLKQAKENDDEAGVKKYEAEAKENQEKLIAIVNNWLGEIGFGVTVA